MSALTQMSLLFLTTESQVLLGKKVSGFGKGNYVGIGGRQEANETIEQTAIRECQEEIGVTSLEITRAATLHFLFPHQPTWNQEVHVFTSTAWQGEAKESNEIIPQWFDKNNLPFDKMWSDAPHWLPNILVGQKLFAEFNFTSTLEVATFKINSLEEVNV